MIPSRRRLSPFTPSPRTAGRTGGTGGQSRRLQVLAIIAFAYLFLYLYGLRPHRTDISKSKAHGSDLRTNFEKAATGLNTAATLHSDAEQADYSFQRTSEDPCWSSSEMHNYLSAISPSTAFSQRIKDYADHHGRCIGAIANLTDTFIKRTPVSYRTSDGTSEVQCQFLIHHGSSQGLGNRLQSMVAVYGYALLTNRVFVTLDWVSTTLLCQPFSHGWYLEYWLYETLKASSFINTSMLSSPDKKWSKIARKIAGKPELSSAIVEIHFNDSVPDQNFFCDAVQRRLQAINHILLSTEQYFLPGLLASRTLQSSMDSLFPDMAPFTHLSRHLLRPSNVMWERITRLHRLHFQAADRRIGVQIRTFVDEDKFAHAKVLDCLVNVSHLLPAPIAYSDWMDILVYRKGGAARDEAFQKVLRNRKPEEILIFVTSLHGHHASFLRRKYTQGVAADGALVDVHSYSSAGDEKHGIAMDQTAFTEMWLLATCRSIFASYFSTFGYVASGLAGVPPFLMNVIPKGAETVALGFEENGRSVCELSLSAEPCFHSPPIRRSCNFSADTRGGGANFPDYVQPCQDAFFGHRIVSRSI